MLKAFITSRASAPHGCEEVARFFRSKCSHYGGFLPNSITLLRYFHSIAAEQLPVQICRD